MGGAAFTLKVIYQALQENGLKASVIHGGGGGLRMSTWRQIFSGVSGMPLYVDKKDAEPTLIGGWLHYSLANSYISHKEAVNRLREILEERAKPNPFTNEFYSEYMQFYVNLYILENYSREFHNFLKKHTKML